MTKLNEASVRAVEIQSWSELLVDAFERNVDFLESLRKDPRAIDVEFRVVPDVKGELTNG